MVIGPKGSIVGKEIDIKKYETMKSLETLASKILIQD